MAPFNLKTISVTRAHHGTLHRLQHDSETLNAVATFAVFVPGAVEDVKDKCPLLMYLSGLTCTDENVAQKGCAFEHCHARRVAMVMPDTSPRGDDVADDEAWDLGKGAGFYVDATAAPWSRHYKMYSYVTKELPKVLLACDFADRLDHERVSISGHSMGGHGALTLALRNPNAYASVSAFAPIANPTALDCPWGQKALKAYLGSADCDEAKSHDATELVKSVESGTFKMPILIDQGAADSFYKTQLHPERFVDAAKERGCDVTYRLHDGYDHSYFFVSTFMREHIEFHAAALGSLKI